ncbi:hypothetical protein [Chondromyces crocatus]|uniref:Terminase large subunit gp17-like C-terminal domain-containing protein n=1 Tax=Chondromyces crocatus TaxID=52 RepID=A0A0K1ECG2_CHOCO|nr:hypothetical protein [Chondromyces crocatus]AKT38263.1 uncharacterized protein CMC5_024060 [Chondromyces crocatus]
MTTRIAERVAKRVRRPRITMAGTLSAAILAASVASQRIVWPSERYQAAPERFFREVLGVEPWHRQAEVLEALVPERARVSVKSGHKVGKSNLGAGAALWFYCCFPDARVILSSVTDRQVNQILWRELRMLHAQARHPVDGNLHDLARTGLRSKDFREVVGFTAKEAEAVAGISGRNLLYILDEASGIPDLIFEAIEGNRAGGARVLMLGNPTRVEGEFFRSHSDKREFYRTFTISSEESPNVLRGEMVIPGLAAREWVEEKRREWGEESALFQVRVRGNFARQDASTVIPLYLVDEAEERWHDTRAEGRLHVGVDVARFGDDDSVAIPRRGSKALEVVAWNGLNEPTLAAHVVQVVRRHRSPREPKAAVKVDACGGIGIRVVGHLHAYQEEIEVIPVNVAERSRLPGEFPLLRDQLWFALRDWLREGGAIPEDAKLAAELVAPSSSSTYANGVRSSPKTSYGSG